MVNLEEKSQTKEIGGVTYRSWPLPWGVGRPLLIRTIELLAPLLGQVTQAGSNEEQAAALFGNLPKVLNDADLQAFARAFGQASKFTDAVTGNEVPLVESNQANHFASKYLEFFQWLAFNMQVNFSGFFTGLKSINVLDGLQNLMAPQASSK